jgi:hypothetical protein
MSLKAILEKRSNGLGMLARTAMGVTILELPRFENSRLPPRVS